MKQEKRNLNRRARARRTRAGVLGTAQTPRLSVFRSNRHTYAQLIDDNQRHTLASASSKEISKKGTKVSVAEELGKLIAEKAKKAGVKAAVFDRGSYKYHGRVKAIAESARGGGLKI